ncbi:MAG: baseplate J/gp47 family protein [Candidatus Gastranaerophilales bacterium]|nr:baseplate J/gp47 family protein [Candidatus Gastranaerophilales bacterium]
MVVWVYKQCFAQTAELTALKFWGNLIGVDYKDGQTANVSITLTDVTTEYLAAGTVYKDLTTGLIFKTISQAAAEENTIVAIAECTTSGTAGNLAVGTVLNIANPLDGIPTSIIGYIL